MMRLIPTERRSVVGWTRNMADRAYHHGRSLMALFAHFWRSRWEDIRRRIQMRMEAYPIWERFGALTLIVVATALDFMGVSSNHTINTYYAAAVKSMLMSRRAFFFVSFDPRGFVSVDKPPLGLWLQALSAKVFGFSPFSLILPQALAGVLSVALLYALVRRTFGGVAGLLGGALLATSPIAVVSNRDNIFESLLMLTSLCAVWTALNATETGAIRWLALCGVCIGLGFNIKTLEAYLILPSCALVFWLGCSYGWRRRLAWLVGWLGVVLVTSFWWITVVDLTPATQRPYVDSTPNNSELDLALNYNGFQRLFGQPHYTNATQLAAGDAGAPGLLRLLQPHLGAQISWFLPVALVGLLSSMWLYSAQNGKPGWRGWAPIAVHRHVILWASWLAVVGVFFTVARFYNRYYLIMLAPAVCALAAIGVVGLWRDYWRPGWRRWLLPLSIFATGAEQRILLAGYPSWNGWLSPVVYTATGVAVVLLVGRNLAFKAPGGHVMAPSAWWARGAAGLALSALAVAPLCWLGASFAPGNEGGFPISGPAAQATSAPSTVDPRLIAYLETHALGLPFLVATVNSKDAAPIMLATSGAALSMGGFSGYDPILTPASLAVLVNRGDVRYFLLPASNMTLATVRALYPASALTFSTSYTNRLTQWVSSRCVAIAPAAWKTGDAFPLLQLFDCGGIAHSSLNSPESSMSSAASRSSSSGAPLSWVSVQRSRMT